MSPPHGWEEPPERPRSGCSRKDRSRPGASQHPTPPPHPGAEQIPGNGIQQPLGKREGSPRHSRSVGIRHRSPGMGPQPREFSAWQKRTRKNQPGTAPGAGTRMEPELRTRDGTRGRDTGTTRRKHNQEHRAGHARWEIPRGNSPALPSPWIASHPTPRIPVHRSWSGNSFSRDPTAVPAWGVLPAQGGIPAALEATGISWNHCWEKMGKSLDPDLPAQVAS